MTVNKEFLRYYITSIQQIHQERENLNKMEKDLTEEFLDLIGVNEEDTSQTYIEKFLNWFKNDKLED